MNDVQSSKPTLRDRLIEAAEALIDRDGLPALRARDLAEAAGCAVGAIYTAFSDLDALVIAVNARTLAALGAALSAALRPSARRRSRACVGHAGRGLLRLACARRRRWDALFHHRMAGGRAAPGWFLAEQEALFARLESPLSVLCPNLTPAALTLARPQRVLSGSRVISMGLEQRLTDIDPPALRREASRIAAALAAGLGPAYGA